VPKATVPKASAKGTLQNKTEIELLIARDKWLETDQQYQAATAQTNQFRRLWASLSLAPSWGPPYW
jgi:hypothetical protein